MSMSRLRGVLFAAGVAGTLGFGATQALASPQAPTRALQCNPECEAQCGPVMGTLVRNGRCLCCAE